MFGTIIMDSYKADEAELMAKILMKSVLLWIPLGGHLLASTHFGTTTLKMFYTLVWHLICVFGLSNIMGCCLLQKMLVKFVKFKITFQGMKGLDTLYWFSRPCLSQSSIGMKRFIESS